MDNSSPQSGTLSEQQASTSASGDVYTSDPDRALFGCAIGSLQAWPADADDVAISLSFYAKFQHVDDNPSYTSATHNFTSAVARNLAAALIRAADHADAVVKIAQQEAA